METKKVYNNIGQTSLLSSNTPAFSKIFLKFHALNPPACTIFYFLRFKNIYNTGTGGLCTMNGKKTHEKNLLKTRLARKGDYLIDKWIEWDINNICPWFNYQDDIPEKAQRLRKYL